MTAFGNCYLLLPPIATSKATPKGYESVSWSPPVLYAPLGKTLPVIQPDSVCLRQGFPRRKMGSQKIGLCAFPSAAGGWVQVHWRACRPLVCLDPNSAPPGNSSTLLFQFQVGFEFHPSVQTCILLKEGAGMAGTYFSMSPIQNSHFLPRGK